MNAHFRKMTPIALQRMELRKSCNRPFRTLERRKRIIWGVFKTKDMLHRDPEDLPHQLRNTTEGNCSYIMGGKGSGGGGGR